MPSTVSGREVRYGVLNLMIMRDLNDRHVFFLPEIHAQEKQSEQTLFYG
jgi:hypothetical protein